MSYKPALEFDLDVLGYEEVKGLKPTGAAMLRLAAS